MSVIVAVVLVLSKILGPKLSHYAIEKINFTKVLIKHGKANKVEVLL